MNFIDVILTNDAKKIINLISNFYPFKIGELKEFEDKLNFYDGISQNKNIRFDEEILSEFSNKLNFKMLQYYNVKWDENLLRNYSNKWDWDYFYKDVNFKWNFGLIWEFKNRIGIRSFNDYLERTLVNKDSLLDFDDSLIKINGNGLRSNEVTNEFVKKISNMNEEHSYRSQFERESNFIIAERIDKNKQKLIPGILQVFNLKINKDHEQIKNILHKKKVNDRQFFCSDIEQTYQKVNKFENKFIIKSEEQLISHILMFEKHEIPWENFVLLGKIKWTNEFFINCGEKLNVNESLWKFINQIKEINPEKLKIIMSKVDKYENQNFNLPF